MGTAINLMIDKLICLSVGNLKVFDREVAGSFSEGE
jgi:hypothetical protein